MMQLANKFGGYMTNLTIKMLDIVVCVFFQDHLKEKNMEHAWMYV
jgi:hypothetical protein